VFGEDTSNDILVDVYSKCFIDLLRDSKTTKARVASFQFNDRLDEFR